MINRSIQVYEYTTLNVGHEDKFNKSDFEALARYHTENKSNRYYTLLHKAVRFQNYVGVIKIGNLTIEVLPKCDHSQSDDKALWQRFLLEMLKISLQVEAKTTTHANLQIRSHSVLETYLNLFMDEVQKLIHHGLVKKYRFSESNENSLKGKLLVHKQVTRNIVHAERFCISHQVYDRNNRYNALLYQALLAILAMTVSVSTTRRCQSLLLNFPDCTPVPVSEKTFSRLTYDRKTQTYRTALDLARIILLNYHPDLAGGHNNILAIMFDMNQLWENYIFYSLKTSADGLSILRQKSKKFWENSTSQSGAYLRPDIVVKKTPDDSESIAIIDTKWKYESKISEQDLRQIFTYNNYFASSEGYLLYPDNRIHNAVTIEQGKFLPVSTDYCQKESQCSIIYVNPLCTNETKKISSLRHDVGKCILDIIRKMILSQ